MHADEAAWKKRLDAISPSQEDLEGLNWLQDYMARAECESCGGKCEHVDPDGSTWCLDCLVASEEDDG